MNIDNETQINAAYTKAEKKLGKGEDSISSSEIREDNTIPKRYEIACLVGPTTEEIAKKIVSECKDDSRGRSHNVIGLLIAASNRESIVNSSNWNAVYQVDALITEIPNDDSVILLFEPPRSKKNKRPKKSYYYYSSSLLVLNKKRFPGM